MLASLLLPLTLLVQAPSEKDLFDGYLNRIRLAQQADGSYGRDATVTADILIGMSLSPRAYRVDDGPFMRDAVAYLLENVDQDTTDPDREWRVALALAHVHRDRYFPTVDRILERHEWSVDRLHSAAAAEGTPWTLTDLPEDATLAETARMLADAGLVRTYGKGKAEDPTAVDYAAVDAAFERGVQALLARRGASGYWEVFGQPQPGISALAAQALLNSKDEEARAVGLGVLDWLVSLQQEDGSIHDGRVAVYTTSVAVGAMVAGGRESDKEVVGRAVAYLKAMQTDEGEGYTEADKFYGGIGYGGDLRPDLSNLNYALQALHEVDTPVDDPAYQRALYFLQRSQNRSETNTEVFYDQGDDRPIQSGNDGGGIYYPGNSPAGTETLPDGTIIARSYGSMTYALLKCYLFAGLSADDPRVVDAVRWIADHFTVEVNPGFDPLLDPRGGFQGLYYYYLTMAQALEASGYETLVSTGGQEHHWRPVLADKLLETQKEDGTWVNADAPRWWEGNPDLCTAYVLGALAILKEPRD
ncbi:MAG: prenyltransferase/squalene oxidase repeat-containing protein [Planctomycetota bacterium]|jgi:squalene-hopene/tetraprenyl-beta-curcumene cyclase